MPKLPPPPRLPTLLLILSSSLGFGIAVDLDDDDNPPCIDTGGFMVFDGCDLTFVRVCDGPLWRRFFAI